MMTANEKLDMVKTIMGTDAPSDAEITSYLSAAKSEILSWRYSYAASIPDEVPAEYEMTQVQAVINGFTQRGNAGETVSVENGIHRHFAYSDMVRYIRANVIPIARVGASAPSSATPASEDVVSA